MMRSLVVLAALLFALSPASGLAADKDKARGGGAAAAQKSESKAERGDSQKMEGAERGQGRAAQVASDSEKHLAKEQEKAEKDAAKGKASDEPGVFGRMQRFFGFGQSQEKMSEQGREHERATEQERGPQDR